MATIARHILTLDPMGILHFFINSSDTARPILTRLKWNVYFMVLFKSYVRFCRGPSSMAAMARHSLTLDPMGILHFCQLL